MSWRRYYLRDLTTEEHAILELITAECSTLSCHGIPIKVAAYQVQGATGIDVHEKTVCLRCARSLGGQ